MAPGLDKQARRDAGPSRMALDGAYGAHRAAALAGVPRSTLYYWARKGVVEPSISQTKEKLWSYADLMGLRIVQWLRKNKCVESKIVQSTPMAQVRNALATLAANNVDLWHPGGTHGGSSPILVDRSGRIHIESPGSVTDLHGQQPISKDFCSLLGPFDVAGFKGPDLVSPRPSLRIVPGKLSGEPHVQGSRIPTLSLAALRLRGLGLPTISSLYPDLSLESIREALDLEAQLAAHEAA